MQKKKQTKSIILITLAVILLLLLIFAEDIIKLQNRNKLNEIQNTAQAQYITTIGDETYDITNAVSDTPNPPTISAGMIPIKWDGNYWTITNKNDENWYDYSNGKPAYIMLNDGTYQSELIQDMTGKRLAEENMGAQIQETELGTIYMWLPRFAYNEKGEIIHIKQGYSVAGSWTIPEIFTYETEKMDFSLAGVWIEYNSLSSTSEVNKKINNMNKEESIYGFLANTKSIAMNETDLTAIEKYSVEINSTINNITNKKRTVLKITNSNQLEPIKAKAYYDETEEKIKIEVINHKNVIVKILDKNGTILSENSTTADTGEEVIGNKTYKFIIIDNVGNQKQVTTSVSGLDVYIIENEDDLKYFRDAVNNGKTTTNTKAIQIADVKLNEGKYTINEETKEITFTDNAEQWTPIKKYYGKYYGNNYTISGLYIKESAPYKSLFVYGTDGMVLQDLNLTNSSITGSQYVGGFVAYAYGTCTITNCNFSGNLKATSSYTGGIVGYIATIQNVNIENCSTTGIIEGTLDVGGFVGYVSGKCTIINCNFSGNLKATSSYSGGIVGYIPNAQNVNIENCSTTGIIEGNSYVGGIVGQMCSDNNKNREYEPLIVKDCNNNAYIKGNSDIGGIIGRVSGEAWDNYSVIKCSNNGNILGTSNVGGIIGSVNFDDEFRQSKLTMLSNKGNVTGTGNYIGRNNWIFF